MIALSAPTAVARPADLRLESPTSALSGTTGETVFGGPRDAALAQERYYSSYGTPTGPTRVAATAATDGDGIASGLFAFAIFGALVVGMAAGSGLHVVHNRRHPARLAT